MEKGQRVKREGKRVERSEGGGMKEGKRNEKGGGRRNEGEKWKRKRK